MTRCPEWPSWPFIDPGKADTRLMSESGQSNSPVVKMRMMKEGVGPPLEMPVSPWNGRNDHTTSD